MASEQDQLLASRQEGWRGFSRFLFWGTIDAAVVTLIATLFYINGPSVGLTVLSTLLLVGVLVINLTAALRS
ncbi:MAG TPA: hypothetical protein VFE34_19045 [Dongiaceae bacterium]|jgi:hypothetical protein|nr:hypothetical protein [Dongiaceae bacterium]